MTTSLPPAPGPAAPPPDAGSAPPTPGATAAAHPARRPVESRDPATGEVWARFAHATPEQVRDAVARARSAQQAWAGVPPARRAAVIRRFRDRLYARRAEVARTIARENGKPWGEALAAEVVITMDFAAYYARTAPGFLRPRTVQGVQPALLRKRARVLREPYGVIAVIAPWNYPFMLGAATAIPALLCGNAVVLKPSEFTPSSAELVATLLREAGLPEDLFQVVQGDGAVGAALCAAGVDKVNFTGSVATGRAVAHACAQALIPCTLELGGSDPALVLADADLSHAASGIAWGRFANAGQTCVAPKRVFVEARVHDAFVQRLSAAVAALRVGSGAEVDVGALIRPNAVESLAAQRDDALARGARVAARAPAPEGDGWFAPTVLADVPADARPLTEETFGPLLAVVPVRDADEAVARANASPFGLAASVWTGDAARGEAIARRLQAGAVMINDAVSVVGMVNVPYGGVKESGIGRQHGEAGLEEAVRTKAVVHDLLGSRLRQGWWFGYGPQQARDFDDYVTFAHAPSLAARLRALPGVLRLLLRPERPL